MFLGFQRSRSFFKQDEGKFEIPPWKKLTPN